MTSYVTILSEVQDEISTIKVTIKHFDAEDFFEGVYSIMEVIYQRDHFQREATKLK